MNNRPKLDPITVEVLGNVFLCIAEEMDVVLVKTSYSTNIKERKDCSCAVFDAKGETIGQGDHVPAHLASLEGIVREIKAKYPLEDIHPEDMFIANDPYHGGGSHLPDITVAAPVFYEGELVAFVANIAHHSDIGGRVPGSSSGDCSSIYEEGLRLPPVKLVSDGVIQQDIVDIIILNCRTGFERTGDLKAQIAANLIGRRQMLEAIHKFGLETVTGAMEELLNYSERKLRNCLKEMPDGEYEYVEYMDDDGKDLETPVKISVKVIIKGDSIHLDFSNCGPQAKGGINVVRNALQSLIYYAVKTIIDPTLPPNGGYHRAITFSTGTEHSILNPAETAAVAGRSDTTQIVADAIFGAFAQAFPERVMAGCNSAITAANFYGFDERTGRHFVYIETMGGGFGARYNKDGVDAVHCHTTNTSNLPVECLETEYPLLLKKYELAPDSGGAGKYRGGLAMIREYEMVGDTQYASHGDRQKFAPWGLQGGLPGMTGSYILHPDTEKEYKFPSGKTSGINLHQGDVIRVQTPGSGGFGNPLERDVQLVLEDVLDGKVSLAAAREHYKVVIDPVGKCVDQTATQQLRAELQ